MPTWTQQFADAFTGTVGANLDTYDPAWIVNGTATIFGSAGDPVCRLLGTTFAAAAKVYRNVNPADVRVEARGELVSASSASRLFVLARGSGTGASFSGYALGWYRDGANIYSVNANTLTSIASTTSANLTAANDVLMLECVGTTIKAYKNGVEILSATDSTYSSGSVGMSTSLGTSTRLDDFAYYVDTGGSPTPVYAIPRESVIATPAANAWIAATATARDGSRSLDAPAAWIAALGPSRDLAESLDLSSAHTGILAVTGQAFDRAGHASRLQAVAASISSTRDATETSDLPGGSASALARPGELAESAIRAAGGTVALGQPREATDSTEASQAVAPALATPRERGLARETGAAWMVASAKPHELALARATLAATCRARAAPFAWSVAWDLAAGIVAPPAIPVEIVGQLRLTCLGVARFWPASISPRLAPACLPSARFVPQATIAAKMVPVAMSAP